MPPEQNDEMRPGEDRWDYWERMGAMVREDKIITLDALARHPGLSFEDAVGAELGAHLRRA